jgi:acetylornithine deacetylase/succinyl-diaminopimelate desuccinylase-like protein
MTTIDTVLNRLDDNRDAALDRLFELLKIPSVSTDPAFRGECRRAADWLRDELTGLGFEASVRDTPGHPMVVAHAKAKRRDAPHVLFYGHYDVQPADPLELWEADPFAPRLVGEGEARRIVARGVSDDKGQLMTFVEACRAFHETGGLPCDVTILFEGEEETGSPSLPGFLAANRAELTADVALVCDTGMWDKATPAITTMLRGLVLEEVVIHAAKRDLHSGMFGGPVTNPIHVLSRVIADLHDANGRVALPDFYDGVEELPEEVAAQWRGLPFDERAFLADVGLSEPAGEADRSVLEKIWSRPDLRRQRHCRRLYGQGLQDRAACAGRRQILLPPRRQAECGEDRRQLPRFRARARSRRLPRRVHRPWRVRRAAIAAGVGSAHPRPPRARGGMGEGARARRLRRVDSHCRRLQARSRHGEPDGRIRAG